MILNKDLTNLIFKQTPIKKGVNKKVFGMMKDGLGGYLMKEFIGLRPKSYAYLTDDGKIDKRAKGVKKCITKKNLRCNDYKDCLMKNMKIMRSQQMFKSERHVVSTYSNEKNCFYK